MPQEAREDTQDTKLEAIQEAKLQYIQEAASDAIQEMAKKGCTAEKDDRKGMRVAAAFHTEQEMKLTDFLMNNKLV